MEVIRATPLSEVRATKEKLAERERKIVELSEAKGELEFQLIEVMTVSASLYEENMSLKEQNLTVMETVAEIYEKLMTQSV